MGDFLDVKGASGSAYRFRRVAPTELPATAGNLLVASGANAKLRVLLFASAGSLARSAGTVGETLKANRNARLFIRLNVATKIREAEHADIVAAVQPEAELPDLD